MRDIYTGVIKRFFDMSFSILIVFLLGWLFFLIVACYCIFGQWPIFFKQRRTGYKGNHFWLIKFRTLSNNENLPISQRRFWLGSVLRYLSLDELPQIANIIQGKMSWIGPRPLPVEYDPLYKPEHRARFNVKPGITGLAQINGRHSIAWNQKFHFDLLYVRDISFALDMKIFFKTLLILLSLRKDNSLKEEKFKGN